MKFGIQINELCALLSDLCDNASNFNDVADLDQALAHVKTTLDALSDPDDLAVAQDLCLRGGLSLFACAKAAKDRGELCLLLTQ